MKHLLTLLLLLASVGCRETVGPRTLHGSIVLMKRGETVTLGETKIWLFKDSDIDAKIAEVNRKLEAEKVAIEDQISDMEANYRLWGVTKGMSPEERASRIPPDQAAKVTEFEKDLPAFQQKLKATDDISFKSLMTVPSVPVQADANHEFSITLPGKGEFAVFAQVEATGKWTPDEYYLMQWIKKDDIDRGRIILTERNIFWCVVANWWLINGR